MVLSVFGIGFPIATVLGWVLEVRAKGVRLEESEVCAIARIFSKATPAHFIVHSSDKIETLMQKPVNV